MKINIAIDGPAGSGKGTTAKLLAQKLNYKRLDTGAMYRGVTLYFMKHNLDWNNFQESWLNDITLSFSKNGNLLLNDEDVEGEIRTPEVGSNTALVSNIVEVREFLISQQQAIIKKKGYVLEGRDATTIIAPDAELKIYLDCDIDERVKRRQDQFERQGIEKDFEELKLEMIMRDKNDMNKGKYSLKIAEDAKVVDTTGMTIDEQVEEIYNTALIITK